METVKRSILTQYTGYLGGGRRQQVTRTTRSANPNNAVTNCIRHMQINHYDATHAEVWDTTTGELHAQVKRRVDGNILILFKRDPRDFVARGVLEQMKAKGIVKNS